METVSTQKFAKMTPRKLRLVADLVRGKRVSEALEFLPFVTKSATLPVQKVIKSAAANAVVKGESMDNLFVKKIEIMQGPKLKRFKPVSRGRAHGYVKAMSHIRVTVQTVDSKQTTARKKRSKERSAESGKK